MTAGRSRRLVIGVGNPDAGDDAAGRLVARRLCQGGGRRDDAPAVRECSGEATALLEAWQGFDEVVVVDACSGSGAPGRIVRFEAAQLDALSRLQQQRSSHGLGVCTAVGLARALGTAPKRLVVYAIEGRDFQTGARVSPEVERAVDELAGRLAGSAQTPAGDGKG